MALRHFLDCILHLVPQGSWPHQLGSKAHTDAVIDHIMHSTIWIDTGNQDMRENTSIVVEGGGSPAPPLAPTSNITAPQGNIGWPTSL